MDIHFQLDFGIGPEYADLPIVNIKQLCVVFSGPHWIMNDIWEKDIKLWSLTEKSFICKRNQGPCKT